MRCCLHFHVRLLKNAEVLGPNHGVRVQTRQVVEVVGRQDHVAWRRWSERDRGRLVGRTLEDSEGGCFTTVAEGGWGRYRRNGKRNYGKGAVSPQRRRSEEIF